MMHNKLYPLSIVCGFTSVWTPSEKYQAFTLVLVVGLLVQLHMKCITLVFQPYRRVIIHWKQTGADSSPRVAAVPREALSQGQSERALCVSRAGLRERDAFNRAL
ncbi:hypothetical protein QQF64_025317 [Cirrhinus molitorella]|uniref:Uncharacterized protein n=1 Tax=Cirrhinus molitorella TaxID=172907 RepID=A0ABR3NP07_9TELE